ncbi:hypothetical protein ACFVAM_13255, partial [Streptomyces californicus]|uniref:hypothetical protein n=1 Tax=Streptomyces californicus TaxID=67351 RepID=UPI00368B9D1C
GYPDQAALLVGQGEEVQAMAAVLAGVVAPVGPRIALGLPAGPATTSGVHISVYRESALLLY